MRPCSTKPKTYYYELLFKLKITVWPEALDVP